MSLQTYARFLAPDSTLTIKTMTVTPDKDLATTGQVDGTNNPNLNSQFPASKGYFEVLLWNLSAAANANAGAGVSVGNITETYATILKHHGENSAIAYRAAFNRAVFNLELTVTERLGNSENKMNSQFVFSNCVFTKVATATGNPLSVLASDGKGGTLNTTVEYSDKNDTKELDAYVFVFQSLSINTFGKQTKVSLQGKTT